MPPKLLADENVPRPLVRSLRSAGLDVVWIPETSHRGITDDEVTNLANKNERVVLTRDSDYLKPSSRRRIRRGIIYISDPVRKDNIKRLTRNIVRALERMRGKPLLAIVTASTVELYPLTS